MTVAQLIELLSKFNPADEVVLVDESEGGTSAALLEKDVAHDGAGVCISFRSEDFGYGDD